MSMRYEWDDTKAKSNKRKHGIDFADAVAVFTDTAAMTIPDEDSDEERYITIGMDAFGRLLVAVYAWRGEDTIRLISARKATPNERKRYEEDE